MENKYCDHSGQRISVNEVRAKCHGLLTTDNGRHDRLGRSVDFGFVPSQLTANSDRALTGVP